MKYLVVFCLLILFVCYSLQIPKYENCPQDVIEKIGKHCCCKIACETNSTLNSMSYSMLICAEARCPDGSTKRKNVDNAKVYPECCGELDCGDNSE